MMKKALTFAFLEYFKKRLKCKRSDSASNFSIGNGNLLKSKASQHEALGFVIIVALVMIVGVIFLGIRMNKDSTPQQYKDSNLMNFLTASSVYTSDCFNRAECTNEFCTLKELKQKCYNNNGKCNQGTDDRSSCDILNDTYSDMLNKSWRIYNDSPVKYYDLKVKYRATCNDSTTASPLSLVDITAGDSTKCSVSKIGQESFPISGSGQECIVSELKVCENEAA